MSTQGPHESENWILIAPEITEDNEEPAGVVHFDEQGYLALVQCPRVSWGLALHDILEVLNAKDSLYDDAPDISGNFFAQTDTLVERYERDFPRVLKRNLEKSYHIFILKYEDTKSGTLARELLDDFDKSAH